MKTAMVTLIRGGEYSLLLAKIYQEKIRGVINIVYAPHHVVFVLKDESEIAYKAELIQEFETYYEEE